MSATLVLDRFQLMWLCEGAIGKSHLRWEIYSMMVNDVYPQLTYDEREAIFTYVKRDESWKFKDDFDKTAKEYYLKMLARYNPANQYEVTLKDGRKRVREDAYKWEGKYFVGWQRYCAPENIVETRQKPFRKCANVLCKARDICLRSFYQEWDMMLGDGSQFACEKCDFIIVGEIIVDPVAEICITPKFKNR